MNPSRRKILQQLLTGMGCTVVPATFGLTIASTSVTPTFYSDPQYKLISRVCELMIPTTETIGALEAGVPAYLDTLFAHWASPVTRASEQVFLQDLAARLTQSGTAFSQMPSNVALQSLSALDRKAFESLQSSTDERFHADYRRFKQRLTQAYAISEQGALDEYDWQAVPGQWIPSLPLEEHTE